MPKIFSFYPALASVYAKLSSLASTAIGLGASMIGIYDKNENFTGDSVEEALEEIGDKLKVGVSGTFTTADKTVTVTDGIITAIEDIV